MVFDANLPPDDPNYAHRGQAKGMKFILKECGLWEHLTQLNGGKEILGDCAKCKLSHKEKEKQAQEVAAAMAGQDEPEEADEDATLPFFTGATCCMQKVLLEQADFRGEKLLLQIVIEEAGHKCYFLPKFHCKLNPIEMYWC